MELYYVMSILDRDKANKMIALCDELQLSVILGSLAYGTAKTEHLTLHDLQPTEKAVISTVATKASVQKLFASAEKKMYIDIPGNGIMMAIPLKSVSGRANLELFTEGQDKSGGKTPNMEFMHELIVVILSEGHSDDVMDAARSAGATGGTVLHAKGTGRKKAEHFFGVSLAKERDIIYILATAETKSAIMEAINRMCGTEHPADAICFSLPVSSVVGIRKQLPKEEE